MQLTNKIQLHNLTKIPKPNIITPNTGSILQLLRTQHVTKLNHQEFPFILIIGQITSKKNDKTSKKESIVHFFYYLAC